MKIEKAIALWQYYRRETLTSGQTYLAAHDTNSKMLEARARILAELFLKKLLGYSDEIASALIYIFIYQLPPVLRTDENIVALTALPEGDLEKAKLAIGQLPAPFRSQENLNQILLNPSRALSVCRAFNQMPGDFPYNLKSQESLESLFAYRDPQVLEKLFYTFSQNDYYHWWAFFGALVDDTRVGFEFLLRIYEEIDNANIESAMRLRPRRDLLEKVANAYHSKPLQNYDDLVANELGTTVYSELLNELRGQYPAFFPNNFETAMQRWADKMKWRLDYLTFKAEGRRWFIDSYIKKAHFRRLMESGASAGAGAGAGAEPDIGESTRVAWQQLFSANPRFVSNCIDSIISELVIHSSDPLGVVTAWLYVDFRARAAWSELHKKFNGRLSEKSAAQLWSYLAKLKDRPYSEIVQAGQNWLAKQLDVEKIWQALIAAHPQSPEERTDRLKQYLLTLSGQPYDEVVAAGQKWMIEELDVDKAWQALIAVHSQLSQESKDGLKGYLFNLVIQGQSYAKMLVAGEVSISTHRNLKAMWFQSMGTYNGLSRAIQTELWEYLLSLRGWSEQEIIHAGKRWLERQLSLESIWRDLVELGSDKLSSKQLRSDLWEYLCTFKCDTSGTFEEEIEKIYEKAEAWIRDLNNQTSANSGKVATPERSAVLNVRRAPPAPAPEPVQQRVATTCLMILQQMNRTSGPAGADRGSLSSAPAVEPPAAAGCGGP